VRFVDDGDRRREWSVDRVGMGGLRGYNQLGARNSSQKILMRKKNSSMGKT